MSSLPVLQFLGAIGFFLYGLRLVHQALRNLAGSRFGDTISVLARSRKRGLLTGFMMCLALQSSNASNILLIGLSNLRMVKLRQALPITLGADLGTTVLVLLLASFVQMNMQPVAYGILLLGFLGYFFFRTGRSKFRAQALLGGGFLFFGLMMVSGTGALLRESDLARQLLQTVASMPLLALLLAIAFTGLLQSSAAMLGILLSFGSLGIMDVSDAIPYVLGANIGSAIGPVLVGVRGHARGKRLAFFHMGSKISMAVIFLAFQPLVAEGIDLLEMGPTYSIAFIHVVFNLALVSLLIWFVKPISEFLIRNIHGSGREEEIKPKYLDEKALESPEMALANVFREVLRVAEIVQEMLSHTLVIFEDVGQGARDELASLDDQVDTLYRKIKIYLSKLSRKEISEELGDRQLELLLLSRDLESIGDIITKQMFDLVDKKHRKNIGFSEEGWDEIREFHEKVVQNFKMALATLATGDVELGQELVKRKRELANLEDEFNKSHLDRLAKGLAISIETSSIHLEILTNLRRINSIVTRLSYPTLGRVSASSGTDKNPK